MMIMYFQITRKRLAVDISSIMRTNTSLSLLVRKIDHLIRKTRLINKSNLSTFRNYFINKHYPWTTRPYSLTR